MYDALKNSFEKLRGAAQTGARAMTEFSMGVKKLTRKDD